MKRTVNPTGKIRIELEHVLAQYVADSEFNKIEVSWNLESFGFPESSDVVVEIATLGNTDRIVYPLAKNKQSSVLFLVPESSRQHSTAVQISVVEDSTTRMILGATARMSLTPSVGTNSRFSILPVQAVPDLDKAFAVDFPTGRPVLLVSNKDGVYNHLISDPKFLPSILPAVVQTIAFQLITNSDQIDASVIEGWDRQFSKWGCDLDHIAATRHAIETGDGDSESIRDAHELSENVSLLFSKKLKLVKRLIDAAEVNE